MTNKLLFTIRTAQWPDEAKAIRSLRYDVFVREQKVPEEEEWDGEDQHCLHVVALDTENRLIGTGRLMPDGRIGRMAVAADWRSQGVGGRLLQHLLTLAREKDMSSAYLSSQIQAVDFYQQHGFVSEGETYLDAGIVHQTMRLKL